MSSAAQKKRLDDKNSKLIRELLALPANRHCFECGQRGPTYVNVTEGSFCCTSCSGILRGLNPPHRVKSVSMATFTTDEVEKIRSLGNAENARTWLGLYGGAPPAMTNRDEVQAFLVKKYEKKSWHVSPSELAEQERLMNRAKEIASQGGVSERSVGSSSSKPPELDLFASDPFAPLAGQLNSPSAQSAVPSLDSVFPHTAPAQLQQPFSPPAWMAPPPPFPQVSQQGPPAHSLPDRQPKLVDPFASINPTSTNADAPFADFESKFNDFTIRSSNTMNAFGTAPTSQLASGIPKSATIGVPFGSSQPAFPTPSMYPTLTTNPFATLPTQPLASVAPSIPLTSAVSSTANTNHYANKPAAPVPISNTSSNVNTQSQQDKYSALAELDELFHTGGTGSHSDSKPAWMPSGFSTGIPPSYMPAFPEPKSSSAAPIPNGSAGITSNGFGSMPKSNTMGALADYGTNNPFVMPSQPTHSTSHVNLSGNPFGPAGVQSQHPAQFPTVMGMNFGMQGTHQPSAWNNPFEAPQNSSNLPHQPTANDSSWNPFL